MSERLRMRIDGMPWSLRVAGRGHPVLFLHGFSGSSLSWSGLAGLGSRFRAIVPDLPGHGATGWQDAGSRGSAAPDARPRTSVERTADDLARIVGRLGATPVHVIGYSLGARIGLRLVVAHPEVVGRLVLEAPSAGIADPAARAARAAADAELARIAVTDGVDAFVEHWEAQPTLAGESALPAAARSRQRAIRRGHDPLGLAASLVFGGQGAMEPLGAAWRGPRSHARHRRGRRPGPRPRRGRGGRDRRRAPRPGPGAGHAPHLERPDRFHALVLDFLTEAAA